MIQFAAALAILFAVDGSSIAGSPTAAAAATPATHVVRTMSVGGSGGWDYISIDPVSRHLFVSHGDRVEVVDAGTGRIAGVIPAHGVHGIAVAPDMNRGFISNGRSGTMTVFDLHRFTVIAEVKTTGENPDAILFDPATRRVMTFNGRGKNATVFDAETGEVAGTIDIGGKPEFAVSDGTGRVYVNVEDKNQIAVIDPKTLEVTARYPMAKCEAPTGLAIDRKNGRLFSACEESKTMTVVDAATGKNLASLPIGAGVDGVAFDEQKGLAFASNGVDGTITVVHEVSPSEFAVTGTLQTAKGARTIVVDPKTHHVFLPTAQFGTAPAPDADHPHPRAPIVDGTFQVMEVEP